MPDPDRDGYRDAALSLHGGIHATDALTLEANALRSEGHNAYDSNPDFGLADNSETVQQVVGGKLRYAPGSRGHVAADCRAQHRYVLAISSAMSSIDRFDSRRDSAALQGDIELRPGQLLTLGYDWLRDRGSVASPFSSYAAARGNRAGFAQYQGRFGRNDLQAALRRDDNDQFGGHDTGSVAWGVDAAHGLRFTASAGTAFKAPTFNELYYPFYGNPDLRPETSRSIEAGVAQRLSAWHWQLNAYQTTIDDLITYDTTLFAANNLDSARIRGAELTAGATLDGWDVSAQATFADPRNRSAGNESRQPAAAPRTPECTHRPGSRVRRMARGWHVDRRGRTLGRRRQHAARRRLRDAGPARRVRRRTRLGRAGRSAQRVRPGLRNRGVLQPAGAGVRAERALAAWGLNRRASWEWRLPSSAAFLRVADRAEAPAHAGSSSSGVPRNARSVRTSSR